MITTNNNNDKSNTLSTPPPEEQDVESLRKQYENMSYGEMSQRLAENYKQLSEILGNRISLPITENTSEEEEEEESNEEEEEDQYMVLSRTNVSNQVKKTKLTKLFLKSVSSGNVESLNEFLSNKDMKEFIDINEKDEDGTTPLIYAACFGKFEIAQALLLAGAKIDNQDSHGWSALMWATTNNHEKIVKLLLDHGASATTKSAKGRTVLDFVKNDASQQKMADIFTSNNNRDSISSCSTTTSSNAGDKDRYYQYSTEENYESFLSLDNENRPKLIEEYLHMNNEEEGEEEDDYSEEEVDDDDDDDTTTTPPTEFNWDKCMPDQMFVFGADNLPYILDTVITKLSLPVRNVQEIFLPSNLVFLSARFAHYYSSAELAEDVMEGALQRISQTIKSNVQNVHILSYWMTNITRLLYYLKKDVELVVATAEYQLRLSELISETYNYIIHDIGKSITHILEPSMLEYDSISGIMDQVNFVDDWQRFFRISKSSSTTTTTTTNATITISPKSITHLFSSTYYVLQSYEVHSTIIIQALAQFFHFLSCELFNHILSKKKYLCRSKAIQIRMNLSVIEEWIRNNNLPSSLISYLNPSIQLVQLLQCLSQLDTTDSFQTTIKIFDSINSLQIRRCVLNYRYETNEARLSEDIEKIVAQSVDETIRLKHARQSRSFERRRSIKGGQALRRSLSGRGGSDMAVSNDDDESSEEEEEEPNQGINEQKDARFLLPFFVPTTAQLATTTKLIPVISEEWMDKLDKSEK